MRKFVAGIMLACSFVPSAMADINCNIYGTTIHCTDDTPQVHYYHGPCEPRESLASCENRKDFEEFQRWNRRP
jgi:hypothetical protein